jgi:hypothetical protein
MSDYTWSNSTGASVTWKNYSTIYNSYQQPVYYTGSIGWDSFQQTIQDSLNFYNPIKKKILNKNIQVL